MRKALSGILLGILSLMFIVTTAGSSNADVPGLQIGTIGYNARGVDSWYNRNKEYVDVKVTANGTNMNDLVITDQWAHDKGYVGSADQCNSYKITDVGSLNNGVTLRVYVGFGTSAVSNDGMYVYRYMNSKLGCGYRGHFINNLGDTIYISKGTFSDSKSFNFENGYTVN